MTRYRKIGSKSSIKRETILFFVVISLLFISCGYAIVNSRVGFLGTLFVNHFENKAVIQSFSYEDKTKFRSDTYREKIETITLLDSISPPDNYVECWKLGVNNKSSVMGYIVKKNGSDIYDLYIQGDGHLYANPDSTYLFGGLSGLKEINGLDILDTKNVINMGAMFYGCNSLTTLNLSNFNTSNVTDMNSMFAHMIKLNSIDLSSFDTRNVTEMHHMFWECNNLINLDVSNFNTSKIRVMDMMFAEMNKLESLDLSNFDTSLVRSFNAFVYNDWSLKSLNIKNFNTSNLDWAQSMFLNCSSLTSLDLSNFDTRKITHFNSMFSGCSSLIMLDLSSFDTSSADEMVNMFAGNSKLERIVIGDKFSISKVTKVNGMFSGCSSLTSIDLSNFDTSNVTDMSYMFSECSELITIYVSNRWNVSNVTSSGQMFSDCSKLVGQSGVTYNSSKIDASMANYTTGYLTLRTWNFGFTGDYQAFSVPCSGTYKIEAWGAQGGKQTAAGRGGYGGYVSGDIVLNAKDNLYIYVGQYSGWGNSFNAYPEYRPGFPGGGASDIRLQPGDKWYDFDSLKSRIMVAGGGGGSEWDYSIGGDGGGLIGYTGYGAEWGSSSTPTTIRSTGGTQTSGGVSEDDRSTKTPGDSGGFGYAGYSTTSTDYGGLGGGGYYGGASKDAAYAGGGGSSFISGHNGCDAIAASSTETNIIHTGSSNHYSGYSFSNTVMIDGQGCSWTTLKGQCNGQIQPTGEISTTGHSGSGYVRITFLY